MLSRDYEYNIPSENYEISEERKNKLIEKVKEQIKKGTIAHHEILKIGENAEEYDFLYEFLDNNGIQIRGINGTVSGNISNYTHLPKMGQSYVPDELDDDEQKALFIKLNEYSYSDRKNKTPEYMKIRNKLIERNMKLAKWVTMWFGIENISIPLEDKKQYAYIGLIKAVDRFNPTLGYKFSTYACKIIYRTIIREAYKEDDAVKYNEEVLEQLVMMTQIEDYIYNKSEREAKPTEIAEILGVPIKRVYALYSIRSLQNKASLDEIEEERRKPKIDELPDGTRLYFKQGDEEGFGDGEISEGVYCDDGYDKSNIPLGYRNKKIVEEMSCILALRDDLERVLNTLEEREAEVIRMRFGLGKYVKEHTLEEIASVYKLTSPRIRQIEAKAIRKLRHITRTRIIEGYNDSNYDYGFFSEDNSTDYGYSDDKNDTGR